MPSDFDFFNDDAKAPTRPNSAPRPARPAEPEVAPLDDDPPMAAPIPRRPRDIRSERPPPRSGKPVGPKKPSALLIVGLIVGALVVLGGATAGIMVAVSGKSKPTEKDKAVAATTVHPAGPGTPAKKEPVTDQTAPSPEVVERVKKATVMVLVQFPGKKEGASGSGFVEKESRLVLTNAHVVGMKKMSDPEPVINLVVNSGEGDKEYRLYGNVVALDAENDLAVIRPSLLKVGERTPVPDGLVVPKNPTVTELQKLFVFGFPLIDVLGSEISIRPTQVTSLRHEGGKLKKIQLEGGMTFGNSGGPVVDIKGNVVGVAVSKIRGENINFCVPGEQVHRLLADRRNWKD